MINYVINLDRRTDRWQEFLDRIETSEELKKDTFIRISGFDGFDHENELKRYQLDNCVFVNFFKQHKISVRKGVFGCFMSHYITLYTILLNKDIKDDDYVGIFEEDFRLCDNFEEGYKKFKTIDLNKLGVEFLFLGGRFEPSFSIEEGEMFERTLEPSIFYRKDVKEGGYSWDRGTFAYVVKKSICKKLLKILSQKFTDNCLKLTPIDVIFIRYFKNDVKMFDFNPHLFYSPTDYKTDVQNDDKIYF
jgi:GR25 family glycosyltransferase involved in LPS biosynthesis